MKDLSSRRLSLVNFLDEQEMNKLFLAPKEQKNYLPFNLLPPYTKSHMANTNLLSYTPLSPSEVFEAAGSRPTGLSPKTHAARLLQYGPNTLEKFQSKNALLEFLNNFTNPLVILLMVVSSVSFVMGETVNGIIIAAMVVMSAVMNFFQEHQAGIAAENLLEQVALTTAVIRDGQTHQIPAAQLVPGDVIILRAGNLVPADCRLVETTNLFVNQSALTGESFPVPKTAEPIKDPVENPADSPNLVLMGTSATTGSGTAVISATGEETEFGKLAQFISQTRPDNEFTVGIQQFSTFIVRMVIVFVVIIFAINALFKHDIIGSLWFAIAVAVGLTPEFLPMVMSVTMGKGSLVMAKKGVIVKKLTAIPTLGSMTILATDKTGTLTNDHIELVKYVNLDGVDTPEVLQLAFVNSSLQTGIQNPMDEAVKHFQTIPIASYQKLAEIPYDFDRKRMSVIVNHDDRTILITKGAPESMLEVADRVDHHSQFMAMSPKLKKQFTDQYEELSRQGFRVLALATKALKAPAKTYSSKDETGMVIRGLIAFFDSVKPNIRKSLDALESMGIEVKVVTGDNELVTKRVCSLAGIDVKAMLLGHQIDALSDSQLSAAAKNTTIFARFSPAQKNRIILALKRNHSVVGYLGDGINDTPSLRSADIGISVANAVDVAK